MPFCKYCGEPQDSDALFCSECGKQIKKRPKVKKAKVKVGAQCEVIVLTEASYHENLLRYPNKRITPETISRVNSLRMRVAQYSKVMCIITQFVEANPKMINETEWQRLEEFVANKYQLSNISIFRRTAYPRLTQDPGEE